MGAAAPGPARRSSLDGPRLLCLLLMGGQTWWTGRKKLLLPPGKVPRWVDVGSQAQDIHCRETDRQTATAQQSTAQPAGRAAVASMTCIGTKRINRETEGGQWHSLNRHSSGHTRCRYCLLLAAAWHTRWWRRGERLESMLDCSDLPTLRYLGGRPRHLEGLGRLGWGRRGKNKLLDDAPRAHASSVAVLFVRSTARVFLPGSTL
ncbi:hypothetical protein IWX47DRAFT_720495 [Phyllosticta citricarpa]